MSELPGSPAEREVAFPTLTDDQLSRLASYGTRRRIEAGEFVFVEGQSSYEFVVIVNGELEILRRGAHDDQPVAIAAHGAGRFLGELNLLTGGRTTLAGRARVDSEVVLIDPVEFRRFMASENELADLVFRALVARREMLRGGLSTQMVRVIGSQYSPGALEVRSFLRRSRTPHEWVDLDDIAADEREALLDSLAVSDDDLPVVVTPTALLRRATPGELATELGLVYQPGLAAIHDLAVVGAGPGGLAAAGYGASEGLETVLLDGVGVGGQAGASSRIENYLGFPSGISGSDLVERAALQALRLGAKINAPCRVVDLACVDDGSFVLRLDDGAGIAARTVILATGVTYRKLPVPDLERFEGAGVYYAATELEARACGSGAVTVVGGGNSAGQAALFLASRGSPTRIAIRGDDLAAKMSRYLYDRIVATRGIEVATGTEVAGLHGDERLEEILLHSRGGERSVPCSGLFSFIGADPGTGWLPAGLLRDEDGFVRTDRDLAPDECPHGDPLPFETSIPGIFAIGDVRRGSVKRVAAAVGEGSSAVRSVHAHLTGTTG